MAPFLTVRNGKATNRRSSSKSKKTEYPRKATGMVYLIKCELDCGDTVVKIGITTRRSIVERLAENLVALFNTFRYIPRTTVKKFSRTPYYFEIEKYLHDKYSEDRYTFDKKFPGYSEFFLLRDEKELIDHYTLVMKSPLDYIVPTDKTKDKQEAIATNQGTEEDNSVNNIEPIV